MADEVYEGAIGIDLGTFNFESAKYDINEFLLQLLTFFFPDRHDILLRYVVNFPEAPRCNLQRILISSSCQL
jgi:hypothetical protein